MHKVDLASGKLRNNFARKDRLADYGVYWLAQQKTGDFWINPWAGEPFMADSAQHIRQLANAQVDGRADPLRALAHRCRSATHNIGALRSSTLCEEIGWPGRQPKQRPCRPSAGACSACRSTCRCRRPHRRTLPAGPGSARP